MTQFFEYSGIAPESELKEHLKYLEKKLAEVGISPEEYLLCRETAAISKFQLAWCECNKPYFKVSTGLLRLFLDTDLTVPSKYLKLPFKAFCIRLDTESDFSFYNGKAQTISSL
jgi:hypothetical protein